MAITVIFKTINTRVRNVSKYRFPFLFFKKTDLTKIKNIQDRKKFGNRKGEEIANPKKI